MATETATGTRGPYRTGIRRKEQLISAAIDVFGEFGFTGGTIRSIADRVGVSHAALLQHFGSKEGLLMAVLREWDHRTVEDGLADLSGLDYFQALPEIMAAHGIDYVATASSAYPLDLYDKIRKSLALRGTKYIRIHTPCPPGWVFPTADTVRIGRMAIESGLVVQYEVEDGVFRFTSKSKDLAERGDLEPVEDCIRFQGRFRDIDEASLGELQRWVTARWESYLERAGLGQMD